MPAWTRTWKGGRVYLNPVGQEVFVIERRAGSGIRRAVKLLTHDEDLANGQLALFLADPLNFSVRPAAPPDRPDAVFITVERLTLYMEHIRKTVKDHRQARRNYLHQWAGLKLDLRTADRKALRAALASFDGGHRGRVEALNAFARFLVKEGDLPSWNPLVSNRDPESSRAERRAYTLTEIRAAYAGLQDQQVKDLFLLRASAGMHQTEIDQLAKAQPCTGPLPDRGVWLRTLPEGHEIRGVLQVQHKNRHLHRQPLTAEMLAAAERLRVGVPHRVAVWKALKPVGIVPSNLRHTFATLSGECGRLLEYGEGGGLPRNVIARAMGHRAGSTMLADRYDKLQVPPFIFIPLVLI